MQSSSISSSAALGSIAARLHEIYRECLEHSSWATIVLETSTERISFSCRKPPAAAPSRVQGKKRPANARRKERSRKRREEWLERRNCRSQTSLGSAVPPGVVAAPPAADTSAVLPAVTEATADLTAATASSYAAVAATTLASSKHHSASDKAVSSRIATAAKASPFLEPQEPKKMTRTSENSSDVAKRRNISQMDSDDSSSHFLFEAPASAEAPPPGYVICNICQVRHHDWVYSRCKHCKF
jgi:hypothetical protein